MTPFELAWVTVCGFIFGYRTNWSAQADWAFVRQVLRLVVFVCVLPAIYEYATIASNVDMRFVLSAYALIHAAVAGFAAAVAGVLRIFQDWLRAHTFLFGPR